MAFSIKVFPAFAFIFARSSQRISVQSGLSSQVFCIFRNFRAIFFSN